MTTLRRPLLLAAAVVLATAGIVAALVCRAPAPVHVSSSPTTRPDQQPLDGTAARRRIAFALEMERRLRGRGRAMTVRAAGDGASVFEVNWTLRADPDHQRQLQAASPLHAQLRGLGFRKIELRVTERPVWSRDF